MNCYLPFMEEREKQMKEAIAAVNSAKVGNGSGLDVNDTKAASGNDPMISALESKLNQDLSDTCQI